MNQKKCPIRVSALCLPLDEREASLEYLAGEITKAAVSNGQEPQLIVTPFLRKLIINVNFLEDDLRLITETAVSTGAYLAIACVLIEQEGPFFSSLLIDPQGHVIFRYDKTHNHAPDEEILLGRAIPISNTPFGRVGFALTSDIFHWDLFASYEAMQADLVIWQDYPQALRDNASWSFLLPTRAFDLKSVLVCAMYADNHIYLTNRHSNSVPGSTWGQSLIINRNGAILAGSGFNQGVATSLIFDSPAKLNPFGEMPLQTRDVFSVESVNSRSVFKSLTDPIRTPQLAEFRKRTARVITTIRPCGDNWLDDREPVGIFELLERAAEHKPDIILFSEENTKVSNSTTKASMERIGKWAADNKCYVLIGGLRDESHLSIAYLWDRSGLIVFRQPIYWSRKDALQEIRTFDTDFARIGIRTCGDIFSPALDRCMALQGAEIIFDPSWMWGPDGSINEMLARTRSLDNACYTVCSHFASSDSAMRSFILDPYGQCLAATAFDAPAICCADIEFDRARVFYDHPLVDNMTNLVESAPGCYVAPVPTQRRGYRQMLFNRRRPELYEFSIK